MSLIIAIEPDGDQAAQLKDLVRRHTAAELILADTTEHAISAIGQRIPDLVLIPAFLSPEDDEALTNALRATHAAAHVQTLTIPVLGTPQTPKSVPHSVLSRLLGDQPRPASPDSCDPKLFAEQITEYLDRVAKDRSLSSNGNGHQQPGSGSSHHPGVRRGKPAASAAPPAPVPTPAPPRHESRSGVRKAIPLPASNLPKPPERPASDVAALEAALAQVALDASTNKAANGPSPSGDESDALVTGLTSLMERLSAEDRAEALKPPTPAAPAPPAPRPAPPAPVAATSPAQAAPPRRAEPVKAAIPLPAAKPIPASTPTPSPKSAPEPAHAGHAEPSAWKELKELESLEYAMPKNVLPRDEEKVEAAPTPQPPPQAAPAPAPAPEPAPKTSALSDWGDLMESLKKDLGR